MRGPGLLLLLLLCAVLGPRSLGLRHTVHWNQTNPRFLKDDYLLPVAINDYLDIFCPHYDPQVPVERTENFVLYIVDRAGYEGCYGSPKGKRWECNQPHAPSGPLKFSEKIQRFTAFSLGVEFQEGQDYYYISVPTEGSIGECLRLRLSVCCRPTTVPVTEVPQSQPRGGAPDAGDPWRQSRNASSRLPGSCALLLGLCLLLLRV